MPCKALLCVGPVKLEMCPLLSAAEVVSGENSPALSWWLAPLISEHLDRQTDQGPRPPHGPADEGFLCVHRRHLLCVPVFQRRHPLVIVFASVPSIVQEQSLCPVPFCIVRVSLVPDTAKYQIDFGQRCSSARRTAFHRKNCLISDCAFSHNTSRF